MAKGDQKSQQRPMSPKHKRGHKKGNKAKRWGLRNDCGTMWEPP